MDNGRIIGKTVRRFTRLGCVGIKLTKDGQIKKGDKVRFEREGSGIGHAGFHRSTHNITSIQVNHEDKECVTCVDGLCAVKIDGKVPPYGCDVILLPTHVPAA